MKGMLLATIVIVEHVQEMLAVREVIPHLSD